DPLVIILTKNNLPILPDLANQNVPDNSPAPAPSPAPSPAPAPDQTPAPVPENQITFEFEKRPDLNFSIGQIYHDHYGASIQDDVAAIYKQAQKIYGAPHKSITVTIRLCQRDYPNYYNASTNDIFINPRYHSKNSMRLQLASLVLSAFHDDLVSYFPLNWETAMNAVAQEEIYRAVFDASFHNTDSQDAWFEILNLSPALATKEGEYLTPEYYQYIQHSRLLKNTMLKPYLEDKAFLKNLNKKLYAQDPASYKKDIGQYAAQVKSKVENSPFADWLSNNYILQTQHLPGKYIIPFFPEPMARLKAIQVTDDGSQRKGINNLGVTIQAYDINGNLVYQTTNQTGGNGGNNGNVQITNYYPRVSGYTGPVRFDINTSAANASLYLPYKNSYPQIPGADNRLGLFGCVVNKKTGAINVLSDGLNAAQGISNGCFSFPDFYNYQGPLELVYFDSDNNDTTGIKIKLTKLYGDYFTTIRHIAALAPANNLPNVFTSEQFKLQINYPDGFQVLDPSQGPKPYNLTPDYQGPLRSSSVVQFLKEDASAKNAIGGTMVSVTFDLNEKQESPEDFAKHLLQSDKISRETINGYDFITQTSDPNSEPQAPDGSTLPIPGGYKPAANKTYITLRGHDFFTFNSSDIGLLDQMIKTFKFIE
ncbi:hypothetical protein KJ912_00215, partial [Patescibacteria group bacterium]|nr:hypothetical protein [Patescibacteria group bacterium]